MSDIIELKDVYKSFGAQRVLNGVNLKVNRGETLSVIGNSGCGKSVLIKHLMGLLQPDSGTIIVDGHDINKISDNELTEVRKKFAMVFQGAALFDSLNVYENVSFGLRRIKKDIPEERIKEKVAEVKNLQDKLSELHGLSIETDIDRDKNIHEAAITYHLHEIASSGCKAKQSDIDELQKLFETNMQHFIAALNKYNRLNKTETIICCLVKLNFIPSEIGCLLNISPQSLTNIRNRLNKKIFGVDGGAKDLDYKVRKLLPNN